MPRTHAGFLSEKEIIHFFKRVHSSLQKSSLLHEYNKILAGAPEDLRVGDAKSILLVSITNQCIGA